MRRRIAPVAALVAPFVVALVVASAARGAAARPLRVMSINDCGDQLLLALLPPSQITSVSFLARDASTSIMAREARKVPVNHGEVEEVLRDRPDLVIAGAYTKPATRALLKRLRYPLIELTPAESFDDVRRQTRQVAAAVGAQGRGEVLLAQMDHALAELARRKAPPVRVAAWDGGGFSAEPGSMYDALLRAAGARNVAAELRPGDRPGVETLLASAPDFLIEGQAGFERPGLRSDLLKHPVVQRIWGRRIIILPAAYYVCATPFSAQGALKLQADLAAMAAQVQAPLPAALARRR